jgi:hypothetical protein
MPCSRLATAAKRAAHSSGSCKPIAPYATKPGLRCSYPVRTARGMRPVAGIAAAACSSNQQALDGWRCLMFSIEKLPGGTKICIEYVNFWHPFMRQVICEG